MLCEEPIKAAIWHALNHYAFNDAAFLAERLYAEAASDEALYLLATVYYRSGQAKRSYYLLQKQGCPTAQCKFLFAKCCVDLNKLSEAERILTSSNNSVGGNKQVESVVSEFGSSASYSLALLGEVCRKAEKTTRAIECFKSSLKHNPFLWSSFETLCKLGETPNTSEIFKSSSCPRLLTTLTHRDTMTTGSTTTTLESTAVSADNHLRPTIEPMATENMDPSWNTPTNADTNQSFTAPPNIHGNNTNYVASPTPMGTSNENRARPKAGRNLLGVSSSASPFSPSCILCNSAGSADSKDDENLPKLNCKRIRLVREIDNNCQFFAVLPMDTPTDPSTNYITPSPTANECQLPKAPKARKIGRRAELISKLPGITAYTSSSSTNTLTTAAETNSSGVRRSTRLFGSTPSNTSLNDPTDKSSRRGNKGEFPVPRGGVAPRKVKTRRQTRNSSVNSQPLSPSCNENIIPEPTKPVLNTSVPPLKIPASTTSLDGLLSLYQELGNAYMALTSYECKKSLSLFEAVQPQHYNTCWVLSQVARSHFELAQYHLAEKVFSQVRRLDPYCLKGMELYSTTLWHLQNEVALSALAQDLVETERVSAEAWAATGNCYSLQKEHDTAIKFFQRAVQVDPSFTYAYTLLGHEYVLTEELDRAMSCFRSAIRTDPRHYNAWYGVGMIYYKQEKYNLAEVHFRKAFLINPSSSVLLCHIGVVQHAMMKSFTALFTIERAMAIDPKNPLCKFHRATILFSLEKYRDALTELEELRKLVPKEALVYFLMGKRLRISHFPIEQATGSSREPQSIYRLFGGIGNIYKKLGESCQAQMYFSWAVDLDPKGANNQIKEAVDKRYLPEDDDVSIDDVDLTGEGGVGEGSNNDAGSDNDDLE